MGSGAGRWWGLAFLWRVREKGEGWGGSGVLWGQAKDRQVNAQALVKTALSKPPFSFSPDYCPEQGLLMPQATSDAQL